MNQNVFRLLVSFVAGTVVVLTMLVVGLKVFTGRDTASDAAWGQASESLQVEYLTPQEAARLLGDDPHGENSRPAAAATQVHAAAPDDD